MFISKFINEVGFEMKTLSSPIGMCYRQSVVERLRILDYTISTPILTIPCFLCFQKLLSFQRIAPPWTDPLKCKSTSLTTQPSHQGRLNYCLCYQWFFQPCFFRKHLHY